MLKSYMTEDWPERIIVNAHADWTKRDVVDAASKHTLANVKSATITVTADALMRVSVVALKVDANGNSIRSKDGFETFERSFFVAPDSGFGFAMPCRSSKK